MTIPFAPDVLTLLIIQLFRSPPSTAPSSDKQHDSKAVEGAQETEDMALCGCTLRKDDGKPDTTCPYHLYLFLN